MTFLEKLTKCKQADFSLNCPATCGFCTPSPLATSEPLSLQPIPKESVTLTLRATGTVDTVSMKTTVADLAGVAAQAVTIEIKNDALMRRGLNELTALPGSVIVATIKVPADTDATTVVNSLTSKLDSAAAASKALGITIEEVPTVKPAPMPPAPSPPAAILDLGVTPAAEHVDSTVTFIGGAAAAVALLALLLFASRSAPRVALATPLLGAWSIAPRSSRPHLTL